MPEEGSVEFPQFIVCGYHHLQWSKSLLRTQANPHIDPGIEYKKYER